MDSRCPDTLVLDEAQTFARQTFARRKSAESSDVPQLARNMLGLAGRPGCITRG